MRPQRVPLMLWLPDKIHDVSQNFPFFRTWWLSSSYTCEYRYLGAMCHVVRVRALPLVLKPLWEPNPANFSKPEPLRFPVPGVVLARRNHIFHPLSELHAGLGPLSNPVWVFTAQKPISDRFLAVSCSSLSPNASRDPLLPGRVREIR